MRIFFDTEFTSQHQNTTLISIGLIAENSREFYAEFTDYDRSQVDDWIQENVIDKLIYTASIDGTGFQQFTKGAHVGCIGTSDKITAKLTEWLQEFNRVEMWSDCLAYDWVLFCQLFGGALNLPDHIYYIPFDICTLFRVKGFDPDMNREEFVGVKKGTQKHNALWDAQVIRTCFNKLILLAE